MGRNKVLLVMYLILGPLGLGILSQRLIVTGILSLAPPTCLDPLGCDSSLNSGGCELHPAVVGQSSTSTSLTGQVVRYEVASVHKDALLPST